METVCNLYYVLKVCVGMKCQKMRTFVNTCCGSVNNRPQTLNREVPGSNLLAAAVVPLGKAI